MLSRKSTSTFLHRGISFHHEYFPSHHLIKLSITARLLLSPDLFSQSDIQIHQFNTNQVINKPPSKLHSPQFKSTMSTQPLKAVTLTHVRYTKGDQIGHILAWVSLIPVFITFGGFLAHFFFRRELQGMFFALGLLVSQFINELIKTSVQQARPATCALLEACDSHGWPSSHAQYMFFFATYFTLLSYRKAGFFGGNENNWVVEVLAWFLAVLTMFSRVYLGYHTVAQVFAGAILGTVIGGCWYWVVNRVAIGYFPWIEESYFGRKFYIKDTSHIPNVLKFEYDNARAARKNAAQKNQ